MHTELNIVALRQARPVSQYYLAGGIAMNACELVSHQLQEQ
jgi:hypothetical protein